MRILVILMSLFALALAVPAPSEMIVNNATKECSSFNRGDECYSCEIPEGWTSLGFGSVECPQGYTEVTAQRNCSAFKNERCCSQGHSGSPGDCDLMIINTLQKKCRFLDQNESVPSGWERGSEEALQCPADFSWESAETGGICLPFVAILLIAFFVKKG